MAVIAPFFMLLVLVAVVYGAMLLYVFVNQSRLLFLPDVGGRDVRITPADVGLAYDQVTLTTSDDVELDAWFVPAPGAKGVVLFCHGNAGNISHRLDSLEIFHRLGLSVLIFDYRGYGRSQGRPSEDGTYLDSEAAWHYLVGQRNMAPQRIVIFGRSLGAAVAARLARRQQPAALIVESAFTSVPDMGAELYPLLPVRLLSRLRYDVVWSVAESRCPLLVVHSRDDDIIPFAHGERIFAAARPPKEFLEIHGGHNEGFLISGRLYSQGLADFVEKYLPGAGGRR